jgi:hypothetical protein
MILTGENRRSLRKTCQNTIWFITKPTFACGGSRGLLIYYFSTSSAVTTVFFYLLTATGIQKVSVSGFRGPVLGVILSLLVNVVLNSCD